MATAAKTMKEIGESEANVPKIQSETIKNLAMAGHTTELSKRTNEETDHLKVDGVRKVFQPTEERV